MLMVMLLLMMMMMMMMVMMVGSGRGERMIVGCERALPWTDGVGCSGGKKSVPGGMSSRRVVWLRKVCNMLAFYRIMAVEMARTV